MKKHIFGIASSVTILFSSVSFAQTSADPTDQLLTDKAKVDAYVLENLEACKAGAQVSAPSGMSASAAAQAEALCKAARLKGQFQGGISGGLAASPN